MFSIAVAATSAGAQEAPAKPGSNEVNEIIVTANKREQSINTVPMTITTASGDALVAAGVQSAADLARVVPGLTAQPSPFNTPVYTLRGVGFYESSIAASPTVVVYTDEVTLPFSAMTKAAALDVERVEVLKGPQGTLFGNNTTGGAINFVANKPTDEFKAGVDASYARFGQVDAQAFISGPVAGDLKARVAARIVEGGAWQYSITRPGDTNGATRMFQGRALFDYQSGPVALSLNLNGWTDRSDSQAPQRIATYISVPGSPEEAANRAYPTPPQTARAADWATSLGNGVDENVNPQRHDDRFFQTALRAEVELSDAVKLTSVSAYERYRSDSYSDFDGTDRNIADNRTIGRIDTYSQELRLSGDTGPLNWVVGGSYEKDETYDQLYYWFWDATTSWVGPLHMGYSSNFSQQNIRTLAAFGNAEYKLTDALTLTGGLRYTDTRRSFTGCTRNEPGGNTDAVFEYLESQLRDPSLPFVPIGERNCTVLDETFAPTITPIQDSLHENNLSWRAGINYKTANRGLVYATVSKGYKAGSFPTTSAANIDQYKPVVQESLIAYETGFKMPIDNRLQVNGALFYYDYTNKQLRGRILDMVFGPLDALVQVPKSRVWGAEAEIQARPFDGLRFNVAATYLDTKIKQFTGYNNAGVIEDFAGAEFPYAPKLQLIADVQYDFALNDRVNAFVGSNLTYNSKANASIGDIPELRIKAYALLDLRAGIEDADGRWKVSVFGRNVTNTYWWSNALQTQDYYIRFTGKPVTYGIQLGWKI
ncbi:TonB-dependent receptor [Novosphingobium resinovorum]|nr:TonB-dependent receptor [Novosphingobium resinovorum]